MSSESDPREPKYYLVKRHLLELIDTLPPGSLVPTERLLTAELGTSRTTVRQALGELVGEGRLVRRQGSGTYVAEPKITWPLRMTSFTDQAAATGHSAATQLLESVREKASEDIAGKLSIRAGAATYCIERLRLVDDTPMAVETSYLSAARFPGLIKQLRKTASLYRVLSEVYGCQPVEAEETIETAAASPREAELLHTDTGAPMLVLGRHSFDADGKPIEWVRSWYRGDRYVFVAKLSGR
ncbi:GntR family transcriptional regulator [Jatrophihabitans sp. GAS493]|uniref:GntR family transcriptional regulator n=1 Tax=Jatrophihabitans sp. GAS493 TaxID=1907575 RepID=UPI000BB75A78|nr:GntR family transcriptional regulator [Jatrophihabitans sp. GAS493]SOD71700.1 GntR family transcriptional regulator [Jatrophihabitans sp. GAS493]